MPPCPPGTIRNPSSKRCVDINGTVGKKLVKSYVAKEIELEAENVEKLKAMGIKPAALAPEPVAAPAAPAAAAVASCPPDKIRNPKTKRCINIDGPLGKSLIKEHVQKKIELDPDNVAKLQAQGLLAAAPAVAVAAPVAAPAMAAPAAVAKPAKCPADKIQNPQTGACVSIKGALGKKLIKMHKNNQIQLDEADVQKLVGIVKPTPIVEHIDVKNIKLSEKVKNIILAKAKEAQKRVSFEYINDAHKKACLTKKDTTLIPKPQKRIFALEFFRVKGSEIGSNEPLQFYKQTFNIENAYNDFNKHYALSLSPEIDMDWFNKSNQYIKGLSIEDFYSIKQYTGVGDKVINGILRGKSKPSAACFPVTLFSAKDFIASAGFTPSKYIRKEMTVLHSVPDLLVKGMYKIVDIMVFLKNHHAILTHRDFYQTMLLIFNNLNVKFWTECVKLYVERVNRIIRNSPPITKKMTVWRGVKDDYFLKGSKKGMYTNQGFISTSLNPNTAKGFVSNKCCLTKITLLPGSRAMFIGGISSYPQEFEVLLPQDSVYYMLYGTKTVRTYQDNFYASTNVCGRLMRSLYMSEVVVVK